MSNSEQRWHANTGFNIALGMMALLGDAVERIEIAGSLRRNKPDVGDVELVMTPKFAQQQSLFGDTGERIDLLAQRCDELLRLAVVEKRLNKNGAPIAWGSRYRALLYRGIPVDLFIIQPDRQWGPTMLIRTGPGDSNGVLVTAEGVTNHEGHAGIMPRDLVLNDGTLWRGGQALNTPEEIDVFRVLGLPYIPPHERTIATYQFWAQLRPKHPEIAGRHVKQYAYHEIKWRVGDAQIAAHQEEPGLLSPCSEAAVQEALGTEEAADDLMEFTGAAYEWPYNYLNIASGLRLHPSDFVGRHTAVMGMTGMGKSNLVAVLCEELASHIPMTVIDLDSEYWSLREAHPFWVVGRGEHVDQMIGTADAEGIAETVMNESRSVILDLYEFDPEARNELLRRYLERLFELEGDLRQPHLVVMEEAAEFLNQRRKSPVNEAAIRLANRGRKRGIGLIMVTQRPAALDKNVLNMCRMLFLLGVQFPQDINAYRGALPKDFNAEEVAKNLGIGQAIIRRAGEDGKQRADVFNIRRRLTQDLGATPTLGRVQTQTLEPA